MLSEEKSSNMTSKRGRPKTMSPDETISGEEYKARIHRYEGEDKSFNPYSEYKPEVIKSQKYGLGSVVMVYEIPGKKRGKVALKVWSNTNVDYILSCEKLPGIPNESSILELAVGDGFIDKFKKKYNI